MSDVYIFGAGPTGLTLAWIYGSSGRKVTVIEKYNKVGGSWATKWSPDGLFTQHSPQILSTAYVNTFALFEEMRIDKNRFLQPFESSWRDMDVEITDYLVLGAAYMDHLVRSLDDVTVAEYFKGSLSEKGESAIEGLCYLLDGVPPSILTVGELFGTFDQTAFYSTLEMSKASDDTSGMGTLWQAALEKVGVEFRFEEELKNIEHVEDGSFRVTTSKGSMSVSYPNELILSIDPSGLVGVLDRSPTLKDNWGVNQREHLTKGIYHSLSIQFHLDGSGFSVTPDTAKGMSTKWGIICVEVPSTVSGAYGTTLSSTILNLDHVKGLDVEGVEKEAWRQIRLANPNLPEQPDKVTIGEGTTWSEAGGWEFDMSASVHTTLGHFPSRGVIPCISIVGPINKRRFRATTMEAAVESAKLHTCQSINHSFTISALIALLILIAFAILLRCCWY